jgi:hypothetical protein
MTLLTKDFFDMTVEEKIKRHTIQTIFGVFFFTALGIGAGSVAKTRAC